MASDPSSSVPAPHGPWEVTECDDGHEIRMATALADRGRFQTQHVIEYHHGLDPEDGDGTQYAEAEAIALMAGAAREMYDTHLANAGAATVALAMFDGFHPPHPQTGGTPFDCPWCLVRTKLQDIQGNVSVIVAKVEGREP